MSLSNVAEKTVKNRIVENHTGNRETTSKNPRSLSLTHTNSSPLPPSTSLLSNPSIRKHFTLQTLKILHTLYPKSCNCKNPNLLYLKVKNRESIARCSNCHTQVSITSNTPFNNCKLNLSYISFILWDMINQYPKIMTSKEISRKLKLSYKSSYFLKKRLQILFTLLNEGLKKELYNNLKNDNESVAVADSVVLYSSSLRANKFRSRRYKTGTASIYLSNSLGGEQKGTLVHTVGINGGMSFYKSIPLNNQEYLEKDLDDKIPKNVKLYTDEGYTFIWDRPNHKTVNHSKRSNNHRYNMSRERWVTKEGVSSNGAEARNNILKQSFRSYGFISPKWSQLYLDEISFLGNVRFVPELREVLTGGMGEEFVGLGDNYYSHNNLTPNSLKSYIYKPLTLEERNALKTRKLINKYTEEDIAKYNKSYRSAILHNDYYWNNFYQKDRMKNEIEYNSRAFKIYSIIEKQKWINSDSIANQLKLDKREVNFIIRKWNDYGIAEIIERKERYRTVFKFKIKKVKLYYLIYSNFTEVK